MLKVFAPDGPPSAPADVAPSPTLARLDPLLRRATYLLNYLTRSRFSGAGLTLSRFWVLLSVAHRERTTMSQLQQVLLISPGSLTTVVDGMVAEDLLVRERCDRDRRQVLLSLSPAGRTLLDEVEAYRTAVLAEGLGLGEQVPGAAPDSHPAVADLEATATVLARLEKGLATMATDKCTKAKEEID